MRLVDAVLVLVGLRVAVMREALAPAPDPPAAPIPPPASPPGEPPLVQEARRSREALLALAERFVPPGDKLTSDFHREIQRPKKKAAK